MAMLYALAAVGLVLGASSRRQREPDCCEGAPCGCCCLCCCLCKESTCRCAPGTCMHDCCCECNYCPSCNCDGCCDCNCSGCRECIRFQPTIEHAQVGACFRYQRQLSAGSRVCIWGCLPSSVKICVGIGQSCGGCGQLCSGACLEACGSICCADSQLKGQAWRESGKVHAIYGARSCMYGCMNIATCCALARRIESGNCKACFDPEPADAELAQFMAAYAPASMMTPPGGASFALPASPPPPPPAATMA